MIASLLLVSLIFVRAPEDAALRDASQELTKQLLKKKLELVAYNDAAYVLQVVFRGRSSNENARPARGQGIVLGKRATHVAFVETLRVQMVIVRDGRIEEFIAQVEPGQAFGIEKTLASSIAKQVEEASR